MNWDKVRSDDLMRRPVADHERKVSQAQRGYIRGLCGDRGLKVPSFKDMTAADASREIATLSALATKKQRTYLGELRRKHGITDKVPERISKDKASREIDHLRSK